MIYELCVGTPLFYSCQFTERLACMERQIGFFPPAFAFDIEQRHPGTFITPYPSYTNRRHGVHSSSKWKVAFDEYLLNDGLQPVQVNINYFVNKKTQSYSILFAQDVIEDNDQSNLIRRLLQLDPALRICLRDALRHRYFTSLLSG